MGTVSGKPKPLRRSVKEVDSDELTEFAKWEIMVDPYVPVKPELSQLKSCTCKLIEGPCLRLGTSLTHIRRNRLRHLPNYQRNLFQIL